jgi:UTP--glucose-1-phosphate uridylyltransferase
MKAIIPAAWFGTRFLPWTKAMPKEMLPIVDRPVIQHVVEEIVESGISDIIIVTGAQKRAIEDHFDMPSGDLEKNLMQGKKHEALDKLIDIANMANISYIRQKWPYGNGTPVMCAEHLIGDEAFAVLRWDEFIQWNPPRLAQMLEVHKQYPHAIIVSALRIPKENLNRYGVADVTPMGDTMYEVNAIVEKPTPEEAPSDLAILWAYILPPQIFDALRAVGTGKWWELWLTDGINYLKQRKIPVIAVDIKEWIYYDTGNKFEYLKTVIAFARQHPEFGTEFEQYLKEIQQCNF